VKLYLETHIAKNILPSSDFHYQISTDFAKSVVLFHQTDIDSTPSGHRPDLKQCHEGLIISSIPLLCFYHWSTTL